MSLDDIVAAASNKKRRQDGRQSRPTSQNTPTRAFKTNPRFGIQKVPKPTQFHYLILC
jgi:hypothetical protein